MKRYTVAVVRERLAEALDEAEKGHPVIIERRGVRYTLTVQRQKAPRRRVGRLLSVRDKAISDGQWSWESGTGGLRFRGRERP
jgi:antitoxin (DNA-binding transcriptional repressor) of toxin-antitoxin stability system